MRWAHGSRSVIQCDEQHLTLRDLATAAFGDRVRVVIDGEHVTDGEVTSLQEGRVEILMDHRLHGYKADQVTVWLYPKPSQDELDDGVDRSKAPRWYSGIAGWDVLFPTWCGERILVKTPNHDVGDLWSERLIRHVAESGQTPVLISLNSAASERESLGRLWKDLACVEEDLWLIQGLQSPKHSLKQLEKAVQRACTKARNGENLCLFLRDLDSLLMIHQECHGLAEEEDGLMASMQRFHALLQKILDQLWHCGPQITLVAFLSDWIRRGTPSPLWGLRAYFDVALSLSGREVLSLAGDMSDCWSDPVRKEATLLRRQFKTLISKAEHHLLMGEVLPNELAKFKLNLEQFLSASRHTASSSLVDCWGLLAHMDEKELHWLPVSLLRHRLSMADLVR